MSTEDPSPDDYRSLIGSLLRKLHAPSWLREDLEQECQLAITRAKRRYDPARGVALRTYLSYSIRGAILDYLRRVDPLSRKDRQKVNRAAAQDVTVISIDAPISQDDARDFSHFLAVSSPEEDYIRRIDLERIRRASQRFSPRQAEAMRLWLDNYTNGESAQAMKVDQCRVTELRKECVAKLRQRFLAAAA